MSAPDKGEPFVFDQALAAVLAELRPITPLSDPGCSLANRSISPLSDVIKVIRIIQGKRPPIQLLP